MIKPYNRAELSFELLREIGHEGKNSKVFIANDLQLNAELVMKQIPKNSLDDPDEYFTESSILYQSNHPNVVPIYYACEDDENIFLSMPYYEKGSLNGLMNQRFLTVREIIRYATQFLSGVHNIHSKGLIHFDIKPDNILISDRNEAVLSDFGLAKQVSFSGQAGQDRIYIKMIPPEAFSGSDFTTAFDVYQVGLTLYRMCVGNQEFYSQFNSYGDRSSFDRNRFRVDVVNGRFPDRTKFPEHIPPKLRSVVQKCLSIDIENRYSAAIQVINDMAGIDGSDLDWQYIPSDDGSRAWLKQDSEKEYKLEITCDGKSFATKKTEKAGIRKINDYCLESVNVTKIKRFLRTY